MAQACERQPIVGFSSGILPIPQPEDKVLVEYVYVDHSRTDIHWKTRTLDFEPMSAQACPVWDTLMYNNFEGKEPRVEVLIVPVSLYRDPFRRGKNKLVFCQIYEKMDKPAFINTRHTCEKVLDKISEDEPWFGLEQEYFILGSDQRPAGWKTEKSFRPKDYHSLCGLTRTAGLERELVDVHYQACLFAGLKIGGINREDAPGQWEYQIGPCLGISAGDEVWVSRYLLLRVGEMFGVEISFFPKPVEDALPAAGVHINCSTRRMREEGGYKYIVEAVEKLAKTPQDVVLKMYDPHNGKDNEKRLKGNYFVPESSHFSWGVGDRLASIRIPILVAERKRGYFEDRRPSSNCDPFCAIEVLVRASMLDEFLNNN
ncbi:hypothetical protein ScPMuIL_015433 [Solemya velum]